MTNELKEYITARRKAVSHEIREIIDTRKQLFDELNRAKDAINALNEREKPLADELAMLNKAIASMSPVPDCTPPVNFCAQTAPQPKPGKYTTIQM